MIKTSTITTLCEEGGLDPVRVVKAEITPLAVTFEVLSVNIYGERMVSADRSHLISHWVKVPIG